MKRKGNSSTPISRRFSLTRCIVSVILAISLSIVASLNAAAAEPTTVGGWGGVVYSGTNKSGSKSGFDAHPWYLFIQGEPVEGYKFFGEFEAEHVFQYAAGKKGSGEFKLERLYVERDFSAAHNVRAGKFFLPFGYWYRLHWTFLTETVSRPLSFNNAYTPKFQVGLQYFGRAFSGNTDFNYYAWLGDGPDQFGTDGRTVNDLGYGASAGAVHKIGGASDLTIGGMIGFHSQAAIVDTLFVASTLVSETQTNFVAGVESRLKMLELRAEYYRHERKVSNDLSSWYISGVAWLMPRVGASYRYDRGDDLKTTKGRETNHKATSQSLGVLWRPVAHMVLKGEYQINKFDDSHVKGFNSWNAFVALKY